jgi:hypothetical protein
MAGEMLADGAKELPHAGWTKKTFAAKACGRLGNKREEFRTTKEIYYFPLDNQTYW